MAYCLGLGLGVSIINNPYEGLKQPRITWQQFLDEFVSIINNPYEGLKLQICSEKQSRERDVSIINNPYEGLKRINTE